MRYIILVVLNTPIILLAFLNLVTRYKLHRISSRRFWIQFLFWSLILAVLVGSYPIYNLISGRPPLDSHELSLFDIVQTTAIMFTFYIINIQRQTIEWNERTLRDLHQELSIKLSDTNGKS